VQLYQAQAVFGEPETLLAKSKSRILRRSQNPRAVHGGLHVPHARSLGATQTPAIAAALRRRLRGLAANCLSKPPTEKNIAKG